MVVKVKKLNPEAVIPTYGSDGAAGLDITAISEKNIIEAGIQYVQYSTGLSFEICEGYIGLLFPRSSISSRTSMILSNSVGILDSDFRGEVTFRFKYTLPMGNKKYNVGDKIGQLVILPYPKIELQEAIYLNDTVRGTGGYGSTDGKEQK